MLKINNLNQYYGESHTLKNIELEVQPGKCIALMGRNGVGKTTLVESIMGLLPIKTGQIIFQDKDITKKSPERRALSGIGYVPQGRRIFPFLTVEENIQIGLLASSSFKSKIPDFIYELFPVLKSMLKRRGGDLSGGQQQQLAFARALVTDPKLLILDEPTEGIQPNLVNDICSITQTLNKEKKMTILLVEQKLSIVRKITERFVILDRGNNVFSDKIENLTNEVTKKYLTA